MQLDLPEGLPVEFQPTPAAFFEQFAQETAQGDVQDASQTLATLHQAPSANGIDVNLDPALRAPTQLISDQTQSLLGALQNARNVASGDQVIQALEPLVDQLVSMSLRLDLLDHTKSTSATAQELRQDMQNFAGACAGMNSEIDNKLAAILSSQNQPYVSMPLAATSQSSFTATTPVASTSATLPKNAKARAANRRTELSRAVRASMFEMMGLKSSADPLSDWNGEVCKTVPVDESSGKTKQVWNWQWNKTMNGSAENQKFLNAIKAAVEKGRDEEQKWADVPSEDWAHLVKAIESAYINLRRERDSRNDDSKKQKKEDARRKNRKRGLKEEKYKRRKAALDSLTSAGGFETELAGFGFNEEHYHAIEDGLQIRYMSSEDSSVEDEAPQDAVDDSLDPALAAIASTSTSSAKATKSNAKAFTIRPPNWRAKALANLYQRLDSVKPPERAYRRVIGQPREDAEPPEETPEWLIDSVWRSSHPIDPDGAKKGRKKRKLND